MKTIRSALAAAALVAALAACGSAGTGPAATGAGSAAPSAPPRTAAAPTADAGASTGDQAAVEAVFRGYYQALLTRDFGTACALNAAETNQKLLDNAAAQGSPFGSCEEAFNAIYAVPDAATAADGIANSAQIQGVTVNGDTATITWSADVQGQPRTVRNGLRRIDGQWRLLGTSA